jgi:hypothetical protein
VVVGRNTASSTASSSTLEPRSTNIYRYDTMARMENQGISSPTPDMVKYTPLRTMDASHLALKVLAA